MQSLLQKECFFKVLFDVIPLLALVINSEGRVFAINKAAKNFLSVNEDSVVDKKPGNVFHCINTKNDPEGCGFHSACKECIVRQTGMMAINGKTIHRVTTKMELEINDEPNVFNLMVSSAPLKHEGKNMAIILIEDITEIIKLKGLIPICASCKKIRNDSGYWSRLETYIENLSDVQFSHDLCPDCMRILYPEYYKK